MKIFIKHFTVFLIYLINIHLVNAQTYQTEFQKILSENDSNYEFYSEPENKKKSNDFAKVLFRTSYSGGDYFLRSNQEYINDLTLSQGIFSFDLEIFPLKNIGLGFSTSKSNLKDIETGHFINGEGQMKDLYAIVRSNPLGKYKGYLGFYFGTGRVQQILVEADPEFYSERISGNGNSTFAGLVLQAFGKSRLGLTLDVFYRNIDIPTYYFAGSNDKFMTYEVNSQVMHTAMDGFNFKLGLAFLLY